MKALDPRTGYLDVQGAPLYYEVAGLGHPLLLLHAGIADSGMWDEHVPVFAQQYQTMRYDLRGYGRSRFPTASFANHEDPALLLAALGATSSHCLGISFGSAVALDFTLTHPELVTSLIMVAPSVGGNRPGADVLRFIEEEEELLVRGDLKAATELNVRMWVDGPYRTPEQVDASVRERVYAMQYHAFTIPQPGGAQAQTIQPAAIERLHEVQVPTLIIVGDLDIPDKLALAEQLEAQIPHARRVVIPGVAHMVNMEQPERFNQIVLDFLQQQS